MDLKRYFTTRSFLVKLQEEAVIELNNSKVLFSLIDFIKDFSMVIVPQSRQEFIEAFSSTKLSLALINQQENLNKDFLDIDNNPVSFEVSLLSKEELIVIIKVQFKKVPEEFTKQTEISLNVKVEKYLKENYFNEYAFLILGFKKSDKAFKDAVLFKLKAETNLLVEENNDKRILVFICFYDGDRVEKEVERILRIVHLVQINMKDFYAKVEYGYCTKKEMSSGKFEDFIKTASKKMEVAKTALDEKPKDQFFPLLHHSTRSMKRQILLTFLLLSGITTLITIIFFTFIYIKYIPLSDGYILLLFVVYLAIILISRFLLHKQISYFYLSSYNSITHGLNLHTFEHEASSLLAKGCKYYIVGFEIKNFEYLFEFFGYTVIIKLLAQFSKRIKAKLFKDELFCQVLEGRFAMLLKRHEIEILQRRMTEFSAILEDTFLMNSNSIKLAFGVYPIEAGDNIEEAVSKGVNITHDKKQMKRGEHFDLGFYENAYSKRLEREGNLISRIDEAIEKEQFKIFFQPITSIQDSSIMGAEALLRWIDHNESVSYPNEFFPLFERSGKMAKIDLFVFEECCKLLTTKLKKTPVVISINLSKNNFENGNFADEYIHVFEKFNLSPTLISFEIKEKIFYDYYLIIEKSIEKLRDYGFRILIDGVEGGSNSLLKLNQLGITGIKIGKDILTSGYSNEYSFMVLSHLIQIARALNLAAVIEGVETKEHADFLKNQTKCYGQGYYYSRPLASEDFILSVQKEHQSKTKK